MKDLWSESTEILIPITGGVRMVCRNGFPSTSNPDRGRSTVRSWQEKRLFFRFHVIQTGEMARQERVLDRY